MKRNRVIFGILWVLSLVGISFFGGYISYGFFTLLSSVFVISLGYLIFVNIFFRIYQRLEQNVLTAGQAVPFYFVLKNEFFFGFCGIRVRFFSDFSEIAGLDDGVEYELWPGTGIEKETVLVCRYRGEYEAGIKSVEIQDFFRLFKMTFHNRETLRVTVKPRIVKPNTLRSVDIAFLASRESGYSQENLDIPVREYENGDEIRHINWKSTARSARLMVRNKIGEEQEQILIFLGTGRKSGKPADYLPPENKMLETVIALVFFLAGKRIPVRVCRLGKQSGWKETFVGGMDSFGAFYDEMCAQEFAGEAAEEFLLEQAFHRRDLTEAKAVFFILQGWADALTGVLQRLGENHVYTMLYLVGADVTEEKTDRQRMRMHADMKLVRIGTDAELSEVL